MSTLRKIARDLGMVSVQKHPNERRWNVFFAPEDTNSEVWGTPDVRATLQTVWSLAQGKTRPRWRATSSASWVLGTPRTGDLGAIWVEGYSPKTFSDSCPQTAQEVERLARGRRLRVYAVRGSGIVGPLRGKGIGLSGYNRVARSVARWHASDGSLPVLTNDACTGSGSTSLDAFNVWQKLLKKYKGTCGGDGVDARGCAVLLRTR